MLNDVTAKTTHNKKGCINVTKIQFHDLRKNNLSLNNCRRVGFQLQLKDAY